jgi:uncharacterized membrane protein YvlD (DUF360 family)
VDKAILRHDRPVPDQMPPDQPADVPAPQQQGRLRRIRWVLRGVRFSLRRLIKFVVWWLLGALILGATVALIPGISVDGPIDTLVAALVVAVVGAVLRPVLTALSVAFSWVGVFLLGLFAQALVMYVGLTLSPGVHVHSFWDAFWASWIYAVFAAIFDWLFSVDEDQAFLAHLLRRAGRGTRHAPVVGSTIPGVVFVQLDGVSHPVLRMGLMGGNLPVLSRWVRSGSHRVMPWRARLPCTTPVSQAGLLHGSTEGMPAFRWYEKDTGTMVVANRTRDAALIESRISDGRGLLADDGASISNLFSGDAPISLLSMSGMAAGAKGLGPSTSYASFFGHPYGFVRALLLTVGEMAKEIYQSRQQVRRGVEPRVRRHGSYVLLRGVTNVLLRDLNVALVAEQMLRGRTAIYVDFVDYDEIAHHAGVLRPESLRSLEGLDQVLGLLERVAEQAPRPYRFVVLSDHGQSQGATFLQRYGERLEDVVRGLIGAQSVAADTSAVEEWGPVNTLLTQLRQQSGVTSGMSRRVLRERTEEGEVALGPDHTSSTAPDAERPELVVAGSGNLGLVWFAREPGRVALEQMEENYPRLVPGLSSHPGVGFIVVQTEVGTPVAIGRAGLRDLATGRVDGMDPLAGFDPQAAEELLRCARFANAPDIYVNSGFDADTLEVAAFEELVGCHGGLGGWQTRPMLVHPADWVLDEPLDDGGGLPSAEAVHQQLVRWLERLGHRAVDRDREDLSAL